MSAPSSKLKLSTVYFWCLSYMIPYKWRFVLLVTTGLVFTLAELLVPKSIQYFIDHIVPAKDVVLLVYMLGAVVILLAIMYASLTVHTIQQRVLQEKAASDVQYELFAKLRSLGFSYFEKHPVGESLSLMNTEVTALQLLYRNKFPASIRYFLFSAISVIIMLEISWQLTVVMIPCILLYTAVGPYFEKKASAETKITADSRVQYSQKVFESIASLTELRAHGAEIWDKERLMDRLMEWNSSMQRGAWFSYWRGTVRRLTYYIGAVVVFMLGPYLIQQQLLSVGAFVAFLLYYFEAMQRITVFLTLVADQKLIAYQAEKLFRFIHLEPDVKEPANPINLPQINGAIRFEAVSFGYDGSPDVLNGFELDIRPGERVALVGATGNGKSTVLKLLARFYDPLRGKVLVDGIPITDMKLGTLRESIGYVFQETYLFGTSVRENIRFGSPDASEEQIVEAAKAANAHDFILQLEKGYDTPLGERGIKLSGGEKQRIALARMMIKNPQIVLLDEATSSLDNVSEREVQEALDRLFAGKTTIAVAHRLSTVKHFDKIVLMDGGRAAEIGMYDELIARGGLFYKLCSGEASIREGVS